eukprot:6360020-Ditylum_brightwellii.AAC.1
MKKETKRQRRILTETVTGMTVTATSMTVAVMSMTVAATIMMVMGMAVTAHIPHLVLEDTN